MADFLEGWKRTHMCGELSANDVGDSAVVMGWVQTRRNLGSLLFIDLRDRTGVVQVVFDESEDGELFDRAESVRNEFVLAVAGKVVKRSEDTVNPKIATGHVEVRAQGLKVLNRSQTPPFEIEDDIRTQESVRLRYRYLDLRRPCMLNNLVSRHRAAKIVRDFMDERGFYEIETPMLTKSTPEGAREYLVPSRVQPGCLRAAPVPAAVEAAFDGFRLRQVLPDREVFPGTRTCAPTASPSSRRSTSRCRSRRRTT